MEYSKQIHRRCVYGTDSRRLNGPKLCLLGNGRLGAMVFGQPDEVLFQLNEDTLWSFQPRDTVNYGAAAYLANARQAIANGAYMQAQEIIVRHMHGPRTEAAVSLEADRGILTMKGNGPTHPDSESAPDAFETLIYEEHKGVRFEVQLLALIEGGRRKA
ncbi:MAG: glycoside hydrolase N-terminal domain-containing protein [Bacillota bacterium]